ncbi:heme utilization cystosolic carrier protein HutX [Roseiarcaceae bacterium H3SJ34-1]|uniref:heme utilization cystosolic carrier protein HutX n=1 Tax=Terripilifer ovatus TaxID=3032367 RepID=UPI003AB9990D|nr:heme utilization cystosolic carrier protein HutX [Roseiarcaceae bacterium H3SJ34-1]
MTAVAATQQMQDRIAALQATIAARPDGVLESFAEQHDVPMRVVLDCLPEGQAVFVDGARFEEVWSELTTFGSIVFIIHSADGVFETKGSLPPGSSGRGYFNVHGESPISGHIKADRCQAICFVDRPFFGRRSCSVQFVNGDGNIMFKVFIGRDDKRELLPDQVASFEALRARMQQK